MVDSASGQLNSWFSIWQLVKHLETVGIEPSFPSLGPFPMEDFFGFGVTISMVLKSLEPGRYANFHQFKSQSGN